MIYYSQRLQRYMTARELLARGGPGDAVTVTPPPRNPAKWVAAPSSSGFRTARDWDTGSGIVRILTPHTRARVSVAVWIGTTGVTYRLLEDNTTQLDMMYAVRQLVADNWGALVYLGRLWRPEEVAA